MELLREQLLKLLNESARLNDQGGTVNANPITMMVFLALFLAVMWDNVFRPKRGGLLRKLTVLVLFTVVGLHILGGGQ